MIALDEDLGLAQRPRWEAVWHDRSAIRRRLGPGAHRSRLPGWAAAQPPARSQPSVARSPPAQSRLAWPPAWRAPISPPRALLRAVPSPLAWRRPLATSALLTSGEPPPFSSLPPSAPPSQGSELPCDVAEPRYAKPQLHDLSPRFRPIPSCLTPSNRAPCVIAIRSVVRRAQPHPARLRTIGSWEWQLLAHLPHRCRWSQYSITVALRHRVRHPT